MKKLKNGTKVTMKDEYVQWHLGWIPEGYVIGSQYKFRDTDYVELAVLFMSREFDEPLTGEVVGRGYRCYRVEFKNKFGGFTQLIERKNLIVHVENIVEGICPLCDKKVA